MKTILGDDGELPAQVPDETAFASAEDPRIAEPYISGELLRALGNALIDEYHELSGLRELADRLDYVWAHKGTESGGKPVYGTVKKWTGLAGYYARPYLLTVTVAADFARLLAVTAWQLEALVFELLASIHVDEKGKLQVLDHDFEGRFSGVFRYGLWREDLQKLDRVMKQIPLRA